jgi:hypothetical protein
MEHAEITRYGCPRRKLAVLGLTCGNGPHGPLSPPGSAQAAYVADKGGSDG